MWGTTPNFQVSYRGSDGQTHHATYKDVQAEALRLQKAGRREDARALLLATERYENRVNSEEARSAWEEEKRNAADRARISQRKRASYVAIAKATGISVEQLQQAARANPTIATLIRRADRDARSQTAYAHKNLPRTLKELENIKIYGKKIKFAQPSGDTTHDQWRTDNPAEVSRRNQRTADREAYNQRARDAYMRAQEGRNQYNQYQQMPGTVSPDANPLNQGTNTGNTDTGDTKSDTDDTTPKPEPKVKTTIKQQIMASPVFAQFLQQMVESTGIPADEGSSTTRRDLMNTIFSKEFRSKVADLLVLRQTGNTTGPEYTKAYQAIANTKIGDTGKKFFSSIGTTGTPTFMSLLNRAGLAVETPTEHMQQFLSSMPGVDGGDPVRSFRGEDWLKSFKDIMETAEDPGNTGLGDKWLTLQALFALSPEKIGKYLDMMTVMKNLGYDYNPGAAIERTPDPEPMDFGAEDFDPTTLTDPRHMQQYLAWKSFQDKVGEPDPINWGEFNPATASNEELGAYVERQRLLSQAKEYGLDTGAEAGQGTDVQPITAPNVNPDSPYTQASPQGTGGYVNTEQSGWQQSDQFNPLYNPSHLNAENNLHGGRFGGRY